MDFKYGIGQLTIWHVFHDVLEVWVIFSQDWNDLHNRCNITYCASLRYSQACNRIEQTECVDCHVLNCPTLTNE